jgi:hypothetical protein
MGVIHVNSQVRISRCGCEVASKLATERVACVARFVQEDQSRRQVSTVRNVQ